LAKMKPEKLTDTEKLRVLAIWLDVKDDERGYSGPREVQEDLRRIATAIAAMHDAVRPEDAKAIRAALDAVQPGALR